MSTTTFSIIGGGWRTEFFMRVAQALPQRFHVASVLVRDPAKAQAFTQQWNTPTCDNLDDLLRDRNVDFVVLSVPCTANPDYMRELTDRGIAILSETPPARDVPEMTEVFKLTRRGARIQVAEQLHLRPMHAARIALAQSGLLGNVQQAQVAVAHGYHGISLIRRLLGVTFDDVTITAKRVKSHIVAGPGREGPPTEESIEPVLQELAWLDFGDQIGVFDFAPPQYFSYVRGVRMTVQGDRGEIHNDEVRYLKDFRTPVYYRLIRQAAGENDNLEGCYFKGIQGGEQWWYTNRYIPAALSDDEIAVAAALDKMGDYARGGPDFYSLAEACQDNYLARLITQAAKSGETITSQRQVWAD